MTVFVRKHRAIGLWLASWRSVFQLFGLRSWLVAAIGGIATLLLIGIPTAIIDNPFFVRQMPVRLQDYIIWTLTGLLTGLFAGTFTLSAKPSASSKAVSGGFLSFLSVGCPICNKVVVLLLGTSGALAYFAPVQLYIGIASLALLIWALHLRIQAIYGICCATPLEVEAPLARETLDDD